MKRNWLSAAWLAALLSLSLLALAPQLHAQQPVAPLFLRDAVGVKSYPAAPRLAQRAAFAPATELPAAAVVAPEELERIRLWNQGRNEPARNGFFRTLPDAIAVRLDGGVAAKGESAAFARGLVAAGANGTIVYSTAIRVEGADRLRLRLDHVVLPEGATLWIYGNSDEPAGFGSELLHEGTLWTPPANGPMVYLEIEAPATKDAAGVTSFEIREVLELLHPSQLSFQPTDAPTCLEDATCITTSTFDSIASTKKGIAHIEFVTSSGGAVCTGGLLNDRNGTGTPYFLTANHCISTQTVASTITSYFDFNSASCNGSFNGNNAPHTSGSTLLATSATNDFTFLRLASIPSGRTMLGWDPRSSSITNGVRLHRVSHPVPADTILPQMYSNTNVNTGVGTCSGRPRTNYIYSTGGEGGIYGGSSGSPVMLDGGFVVGQLLGSCGPSPADGCNQANSTVDGAFSVTYGQISTFLEAGSGGGSPPCVANATTACILGGRFGVRVDWKTSDRKTGQGQAIKYTDATALFWFFSSDNIEMMVKMINACSIGSTYWVFSAATTNVEFTLTVTDSKNGAVKTYKNLQGTLAPANADTNAFDKAAACP
jgi:hypothetical protein